CASAASACSSGQSSVSHVFKAIDVPKEMEHGSLRFSLGKNTTPEEIAYTIECLKDSVRKLREKNPEYQEYLSSLC
ncbi:MAG: cysteine desulfurase NifS, partial [Roseburia sp.]